ncbi:MULTISPECIES: MFS transporter [Bacillaceae]|uniref:MFS transporter n=1 Tax=Bacillaceae TaxID=186817 RepID=UPI00101C2CD0|nr:MFS transporter [Ectobacillus funiculus]
METETEQKGGYKWIVFTTVLFAYFLIVSQRTAPGLITDQLMDEFHISASTLGVLAGIQFVSYAGLQVPFGVLADRFGPAYFLIIGTLLDGLGTVLYSSASHEAILMTARLLVGVGDAMIWINIVLILSQWFSKKEFAALLGWAGMCGSLGSIMATLPFSYWIAAAGWRAPFLTLGLALCAWTALLYFVLVKRPKQLKLAPPYASQQSKQQKSVLSIIRRVFQSRQAWAAFFCHFGLVGTYVGFIGSWAVPYGMTVYHMTRAEASQLIMLGLLGALIGGPITGWISTRLHMRRLPYIIVHLLTFLSWTSFLVMGGKPPLPVLMVLYVLIGYANGASMLTFAVVRHSFLEEEVGVVSGFANMGGFLSAVLLPILFGAVLDYFEATASVHIGYWYGFSIPAFFSFIGLLGGFAISEKQYKSKTKLQPSA